MAGTVILSVRPLSDTTPREEEFVVRSTRLEYEGRDRFHLAYFRHTNRWQPVYHGLTTEQCFDTIEQEEVFWPL